MHSSNMYTQPSGIFKSAYVAVRALWGGSVSSYLCGRNYISINDYRSIMTLKSKKIFPSFKNYEIPKLNQKNTKF